MLEIKEREEIKANEWYQEPRLDSNSNTVVPSGRRLGRNIKAQSKIFAEPGDLIIGTLHTNNNNGMFAISDGNYICESQLVGKIKEEIVTPSYLIQVLRQEFPRQLIPFDLVGRENFSKDEILDVLIPKPAKNRAKNLRELDELICRARKDIEKAEEQINEYIKESSNI